MRRERGRLLLSYQSRQRIDAHVRSGLNIYMLSFVGLSIENLHSNGTGTVEARVLVLE